MNYKEAINLAEAWTKGHDPNLDGWRSVITVLLHRTKEQEARITALESRLRDLNYFCESLRQENERLSLDLGIKDKCFTIKEQSQTCPPTP